MNCISPNHRAFVSAGLFACALLLAEGGTIRAASPAAPNPAAVKLTFPDLLQSYGAKFSLYFTIERDEVENRPGAVDTAGKPKTSPLQFHAIALPATLNDADAFLSALASALPEAEIFKDESLPGIVHIREKSLSNRGRYWLDEKTDFFFQGTAADFLAEIHHRSDWTFDDDRSGSTPSPVHYNLNTPAEVYLINATYRTVLSAGFRKMSNHILWNCFAIEREGRLLALFKPGPASPTANDPKPVALTASETREIAAAMQQLRQSQHDSDRAAATLVGNPDAAVITTTDFFLVAIDENIITARIPLRNIPAQNLLNDFHPFIAPLAATAAMPDPNSLIIRDTSARIHNYLQIVKCLEDAAGNRRAAAVAQGADSHGLAWAGKAATAIQWPPAEKKPDSFYLTPIYYGADSTRIDITNKDQPITQIIPLNHITSAAAVQNLEANSNEAGKLPYWQCPTANCLIITDTPPRIQQGLQIIEKLEAAHTAPATYQSTQPH